MRSRGQELEGVAPATPNIGGGGPPPSTIPRSDSSTALEGVVPATPRLPYSTGNSD